MENQTTYHYAGISRRDIDGRNANEHRLIQRLVKLLDVIGVAVPFMLAWNLYYSSQMRIPYYRMGNTCRNCTCGI